MGSGAGGMVVGGLIVLIGLLILLDNMGIITSMTSGAISRMLLVVLGVSKILESPDSPAGGMSGAE